MEDICMIQKRMDIEIEKKRAHSPLDAETEDVKRPRLDPGKLKWMIYGQKQISTHGLNRSYLACILQYDPFGSNLMIYLYNRIVLQHLGISHCLLEFKQL